MRDANDPILFWSKVAVEAQRRDFTYDDALFNDESGMHRKQMMPVQAGPTRTSRALAIIHTAMYDAMLRADPAKFRMAHGAFAELACYQSVLPSAKAGANRFAAVAGAAAVTIKLLFRSSLVEQSLTEYRLLLLHAGATHQAIEDGLEFGALVGRHLIDARAKDGSEKQEATYRPWGLPGTYLPDPQSEAAAVGVTWGEDVALFGSYRKEDVTFVGPTAALGGAPPAAGAPEPLGGFLDAQGWADDLALVRCKGAAVGSPGLTRTAEETVIGIFWGYDGVRNIGLPPRLYNQCLHAIIEQQDLSSEAAAVLLALANIGMADAGVLAWLEKYTYHVARPATLVRMGEDGYKPGKMSQPTFSTKQLPMPAGGAGSATYEAVRKWLDKTATMPSAVATDPGWLPLGAPQTNSAPLGTIGRQSRTPAFPAYPSGHATFGSVAFGIASEVLKALKLDGNVAFTFTSDEYNGMSIDADGSRRPKHIRKMTLAQAIHENAVSRVYLGVHWRMDAVEGVRLGRQIIDALRDNPIGPTRILSTPASA